MNFIISCIEQTHFSTKCVVYNSKIFVINNEWITLTNL